MATGISFSYRRSPAPSWRFPSWTGTRPPHKPDMDVPPSIRRFASGGCSARQVFKFLAFTVHPSHRQVGNNTTFTI